MDSNLPEHVRRNREAWDTWTPNYAEWAPRAWTSADVMWGQFSAPDAQLGALPDSVDGLDAVEFHLGHGDWIRLLRANGFEICPSEGTDRRHPHMSMEWARQWPCEEIWMARKR